MTEKVLQTRALEDLGFRLWGLGFRVQGLGFRVLSPSCGGCKVYSSGV